jgi:hypothetical protein
MSHRRSIASTMSNSACRISIQNCLSSVIAHHQQGAAEY